MNKFLSTLSSYVQWVAAHPKTASALLAVSVLWALLATVRV